MFDYKDSLSNGQEDLCDLPHERYGHLRGAACRRLSRPSLSPRLPEPASPFRRENACRP